MGEPPATFAGLQPKYNLKGYSNVKAITLGSVVNVATLTLITGSTPLVLCIGVI